jgi:hypothetical protein
MEEIKIPDVYREAPKVVYRLDSAYRIESKTRQFPFVVAHEVLPRNPLPAQNQPESEQSVNPDDIWKRILAEPVKTAKPNSSAKGLFKDVQDRFRDTGNDDGNEHHPTREFLVFHDLEHFLNLRYMYPHSHEVIRCPSKFDSDGEFQKKKYRDDLCRGRLIFDFDLKKPLPGLESQIPVADLRQYLWGLPSGDGQTDSMTARNPASFVPTNFKELIEGLIVAVFDQYYINLDTSRLVFVWQRSPSKEKFSMHLIVKHAFFSEFWVEQMRIFYILLEKTAYDKNLSYLMEAVDFQIPRRNATFRMIGSSKIGGEALEIDSCNSNGVDLLNTQEHMSVYDCLVNVYTPEGLKDEQALTMDNLDYSLIEDEIQPSENRDDTPQEKKFKSAIKKHVSLLEETQVNIDLSDEDLNRAVELFYKFNDEIFRIRDQIEDIINLDRCRKAACPISGIVHEHENAYLKLRSDGHVHFCCRRGCKKGNSYSMDLGIFKAPRTEGGVLINPMLVALVRSAKAVNKPLSVVIQNPAGVPDGFSPNGDMSAVSNGLVLVDLEALRTSPPSNLCMKSKTSAKRVPMGTNVVQVPPELRVQSSKLLLVSRVK